MNKVDEEFYQNYLNVNDIANMDNDEAIQKDLSNVVEGFRRGNIFKKLYWPYKKETYNFVTKNAREKLLIDIMQNGFYAHELNLYLDIYPNDKAKIELFNRYKNKCEELTLEYSKKYEPLCINGAGLNELPFSWVDSPWPWEGV